MAFLAAGGLTAEIGGRAAGRNAMWTRLAESILSRRKNLSRMTLLQE
jgi:hypothetical protein